MVELMIASSVKELRYTLYIDMYNALDSPDLILHDILKPAQRMRVWLLWIIIFRNIGDLWLVSLEILSYT